MSSPRARSHLRPRSATLRGGSVSSRPWDIALVVSCLAAKIAQCPQRSTKRAWGMAISAAGRCGEPPPEVYSATRARAARVC